MPTGDGQQLSLQVQTYGTRAQIYSLSFTEPWFRGRATPVGFSLSYRRQQFSTSSLSTGLYSTAAAQIFYRQCLKWPDDFFTTGTNLGYHAAAQPLAAIAFRAPLPHFDYIRH